MSRPPLSLSALLLACTWLTGAAQDWRSPEEVHRALESLASGSQGAVTLEPLAVTREGRPVTLLTLALPAAVPPAARPALLLVANLEGRIHPASELALDVTSEILRLRDTPEVRAVLERTTLLVVGLGSPDAAARRFRAPIEESSRTLRPVDDDRDGRLDEDGPEDLDGDGEILWLRVPDPAGPWTVDGADPRLLRPVSEPAGATARFRLESEGVDSDGDGAVNEDPPGGVDLASSFPHERDEAARDTGPYPASEAEARSLLELLASRGGLQAVVEYGAADTLLAPPELRDGPPQKRGEHRWARQDGPLHASVQERYRGLLGKKEAPRGPPLRGTFLETAYFAFGLPAFGISLLTTPLPEAPAADSDALREWRPFQHPTLGAVHIGGWRPHRRGHPKREEVRAQAAAQAQFALWLLDALPRVEIDAWRVRELGAGLFELRARITNRGLLPTACAQGLFTGRRTPLSLELEGEGLKTIDTELRQSVRALGAGASQELRWTLLARRGARLELTARLRASVLATRTLELQEGGSL